MRSESRPAIPEHISKLLIRILIMLFQLIFFFTIVFFIFDRMTHQRGRMIGCRYETLDGFEMVTEFSRFGITLPCTLHAEPGEDIVIETRLPDVIPDDTWLDYYSGKDSRIFVDGVVRKIFDRSNNTVAGGAVKGIHMFTELTPEDAGKILRIERTTDGDGSSYFRPVFIGNSLGVMERILFSEGPYFAFTLTLLIVSAIAIVIGMVLKYYKKINSPITAVGFGVLIASLWLVFDSELFAFAFRNQFIDGTMSFLMMPLIPGPFLYYLNMLQKDRYKQRYIILAGILELSALVFFVIHFSGLCDFLTMLPLMMVPLGIVIAGAVSTLFTDLIRGYYKEYKVSFFGLIGLIVSGVAELLLILTVEERHDGAMIIFGLYWTLILGIIHQLYEVREAQQETQMAIRASETKSNFLANMSHEIRTPMNAILGMDEMILREAKDNERVMKYASDIKSAGNILLAIINDILDLSKIESGKAELILGDFDIASVIYDVINITKQKAYDKGLAYHMDILENIPSRYNGDEIRVRQIMLNVINNAIKYTKEGEVNIRIRFNRGEEEDRGALIVTVKDTGIGIKDADLPYLFESFSRLEQTKNRNIEGTGLGLNIANSYIRMMGGAIDVRSRYGEGSEFTLSIPLKIVDNTPIGNLSETIKKTGTEKNRYVPVIKAPNARVLVVDDNEMNLEVICGLMESTSIRVDTTLSGAAALEQMKKRRYDLIFLDQMMPEMDGVTTLQKMRSLFDMRGVSVIALTADAVAGAKEFYLEKGFDGYIAKPIRAKELEDALLNHLPKQLLIRAKEESDAEKTAEKTQKEPVFDFPEDAGIDVGVGMEYTGGKEKYLSALRRFYRSSEEHKKKIREYEETKDMDNLAIIVHALKSNARMIGAASAAADFERLELAAKQGNMNDVTEYLPETMRRYEGLLESIKPYAGGEENVQHGELLPDEAMAIADRLLQALDDFDDTLSAELADRLGGYPFRINQKNKLREAADYIRDYMYDEAADLIREIRSTIGQD